MKNKFLLLIFPVIVLAMLGSIANASTRPRYGGTLRIEMYERMTSLDPRQWPDGNSAKAAEKLAGLIFDRLIAMDELGRPQPQLAIAWRHKSDYKRWEFTLRTAVKFHDGSSLSAADVVAALQPILGSERQIAANGEVVVIQSAIAMPDLLEELASGRYFVFKPGADGSVSGTGPFRLVPRSGPMANPPANRASVPALKADKSSRADGGPLRALFAANVDSWNGRPFVDFVEVTMGVPPQDQFQDLQLGRADLIELTSDQVRRALQIGLRAWSSAPVRLAAIVFDHETSAAPGMRRALSLSIDRAAIANVLLQKVGEPTGALLPQWLSGYAILFSAVADRETAQQLRRTIAGGTSPKPIVLGVEDDDTTRLIAERVVLDARQAGIVVQISVRGRYDARLITRYLDSLAADSALFHLTSSFDPSDESAATLKKIIGNDPEQTYAAERAMIDSYRAIPLVYLPETVGLGAQVRDWMPLRWADWRLEEVWLDRPGVANPSVSGTGTSGEAKR